MHSDFCHIYLGYFSVSHNSLPPFPLPLPRHHILLTHAKPEIVVVASSLCNLNYAWLFRDIFGQRSYLIYIKIT